jgi:YD repeat-containing protein
VSVHNFCWPKSDRIGAKGVGGPSGAADKFGYDALNRLTGHTDPLGQFTLTYLGQTGQIMGRVQTAAGFWRSRSRVSATSVKPRASSAR